MTIRRPQLVTRVKERRTMGISACALGLSGEDPLSRRLLGALGEGAKAWVPTLLHLELANILLGVQRRGCVDKAGIERFFACLAAYDITVDSETVEVAWTKTFSLGEAFGFTLHDAAYLELALRR